MKSSRAPLTHIALDKSPNFRCGLESGYLYRVLHHERPKKYIGQFFIENQEQIFVTIQRCGYNVGEWKMVPGTDRFQVAMTRRT